MATVLSKPLMQSPSTSLSDRCILLTVNSHGELYYWVAPFLRALSAYSKPPEVWVFVPPCQFSSGEEARIVSFFPLVKRVFPPKETIKTIMKPRAIRREGKGLVIFFGGDVFAALLLKKRSGFPLWVYGHPPKWARSVDAHLARFRWDHDHSDVRQKFFLGDLLRSVSEEIPLLPGKNNAIFPPGRPRILFLPGSRPMYYSFLLPFFVEVAQSIRASYERASFSISFPAHYSVSMIEGIDVLKTHIKPQFGYTSRLIEESDCSVAVPGSNNLEIAYRRKKGVVILPLDRPEKLPLEGLGGWLEKIPFFGTIVKRNIVLRVERSKRWISLPNLLTDREILPEIRGKVDPKRVAKELDRLLQCPEQDYPFPEPDYPTGAAQNLSDLVMKYFEGAPLPW